LGSSAQQGDGASKLPELFMARSGANAMDRRFQFLPIGFQKGGHLFFAGGRPRSLRGRFLVPAVVGQRLGVGQQPGCLPQHSVDEGSGWLAFCTTPFLLPPVEDFLTVERMGTMPLPPLPLPPKTRSGPERFL
jgi:hypothetical protein